MARDDLSYKHVPATAASSVALSAGAGRRAFNRISRTGAANAGDSRRATGQRGTDIAHGERGGENRHFLPIGLGSAETR